MAAGAEAAASAEAIKERANAAFKEKRYATAVDLYNEALALNPESAVYLSNRSFANLRLENFGSAIADATEALRIDPKYVKAYYRRGSASLAMAKFREGLKDFKLVAKMCPRDPDAQRKLKECEAALRKIRFEEAIAGEEDSPVSDTLDPDEIVVEESYGGPRLEGEKRVTLEFVTKLIECFKQQKGLHRKYAFEILLQAKQVLSERSVLVDIPVPEGTHFTVCGDVHGQFYDLCNIFEINGLPSESNPYLFNGDFVDRGSFSVEVILTLLALLVLYPDSLFLHRGNHETTAMNKIYGFDGEVRAKFNETMSNLFTEVFRCLPLASVVGGQALVVHGGLFSNDSWGLDEIRAIDRFREPPDEGPFCELLWSDPAPQPGRAPSKRGVGVAFGPDVTKRFLEANQLKLLVRSHEVKDEGFEVDHDGRCITVFSAPNYCDQMGNKGAFIKFESDMVPRFSKFDAVPHPPVRPMQYASSFMNFI